MVSNGTTKERNNNKRNDIPSTNIAGEFWCWPAQDGLEAVA